MTNQTIHVYACINNYFVVAHEGSIYIFLFGDLLHLFTSPVYLEMYLDIVILSTIVVVVNCLPFLKDNFVLSLSFLFLLFNTRSSSMHKIFYCVLMRN